MHSAVDYLKFSLSDQCSRLSINPTTVRTSGLYSQIMSLVVTLSWTGLGWVQIFKFPMGWVTHLMGWVGSAHGKWTCGQL